MFEVVGLIVTCLVVGVCTVLYFETRRRTSKVAHIDGPPRNALLGCLPTLWKLSEQEHLSIWLEWARRYGTVFAIAMPGNEPVVFLSDPDDVMYVLKDNFANYPKGHELVAIFEDLAGRGIFNANGDNWYYQRKLASHVFKTRSMRSYFDTFVKHGGDLIARLEQLADAGETFDLQQLLYFYTFDSISAIAFGYEAGTLRTGSSQLLQSFDTAQRMVERRGRSPFYLLTGYTSAADRQALAYLDAKCYEIIAARKQRAGTAQEGASKDNDEDLLALYMRDSEHDERFLRDMILNFMLAGRDTTATTLTWCLYLLATHPASERRLLDELATSAAEVSFATLTSAKQLRTLRHTLDETLRLYPPVPFDPKECVRDDVLPGSGTPIKAGTVVLWCAYITGRLQQYWGPTADQFDPERWQRDAATIPKIFQPFDFPFQWGPRACLGRDLARLEMATVLALVLPRFRFEPQAVPVPGKAITLNALNGVPMKVYRR